MSGTRLSLSRTKLLSLILIYPLKTEFDWEKTFKKLHDVANTYDVTCRRNQEKYNEVSSQQLVSV